MGEVIMDIEEIAETIRRKGVTREEVARQAGLSLSYINKLLRRERVPTERALEALSYAVDSLDGVAGDYYRVIEMHDRGVPRAEIRRMLGLSKARVYGWTAGARPRVMRHD